MIPSSFETTENIILNLRDSDFSTSTAIANVINDIVNGLPEFFNAISEDLAGKRVFVV